VVGLLDVGCGIFETRAPDEPEQASSNFVPPTEPSIVFTNMASALRDLNTVNYMRSFADSSTSGSAFFFDASPVARTRFAALFLAWSRELEQQYFENMKSRLPAGTAPSLTLTLDQQSIGSDSVVVEATYHLQVPHQLASVPQIARGKAQFALTADRNRNWVIVRWVDLPNTQNEYTWSELKGEFAQ
jgi:hypothetical protein